MVKIIYSFKLFLFREHCSFTKQEERGIETFLTFIDKAYPKAWFSTPLPIPAPRHNLEHLQRIASYKGNATLSTEVTKVFSRHLWYLGKELVALSFVDDEVSAKEK